MIESSHVTGVLEMAFRWFLVVGFLLAANTDGKTEGQSKVMTNDDVLELVRLGVEDQVIVGMIGSKSTRFSLTAEHLERLRTSGASKSVIGAMLETERGTLRVVTDPVGAKVHLGGRQVGVTPYLAELSPGEYTVKLERGGYSTEEWTATIAQGEETLISTTMQGRSDRE